MDSFSERALSCDSSRTILFGKTNEGEDPIEKPMPPPVLDEAEI